MSTIERKTTKELGKHALTSEELKNLGMELAEAVNEIQELNDRLKSATGQIKSEILITQGRVNLITSKLTAKYETREIPVEIMKDYDTKMVSKYNMETGERISTRAMTENELQMELPFLAGAVPRQGETINDGRED